MDSSFRIHPSSLFFYAGKSAYREVKSVTEFTPFTYLASPGASYITGAGLRIDGGYAA